MSKISNQIQHEISNLTKLGQKKKEAQKEARIIYNEKHGSLEGYNISKTYTIRSIDTALAYRNSGEQFAAWLKEEKSINKIKLVTRELAGEYLKQRQEKGLSAWTLKKDLAAINKIFDFNLTSKELDLKERKLINIKRSRSGPDKSRPGLIEKYREQIMLINSCGCRRSSVTRVEYQDIVFKDNIAVAVKLIEKGGKARTAPVLTSEQQDFTAMIEKYCNSKDNIFNDFDNHVEAHFYRANYAKSLYKELYVKKGSELNPQYKGYDAIVLGEVSKALGHNRLNVVVNNYLY